MIDKELWQEWIDDFKTGGEHLPDISSKVRRSAMELVLELVGVFVVIPAVIVLAIYKASQGFAPDRIVLLVFTLIVLGISVYAFFKFRRGAFRAQRETPRALLDLLKKQEGARLRDLALARKLLIVVGAVVTLRLPFKLWMNRVEYAEEPWRLVWGTCIIYGVLALCFFVTVLWRRKKEHALEILREIEHSFD